MRVHNLYVEREDYQILRSLNLVVDRGSVHVVLGLNGSGKSTLAYTLVGSGGYVPSDGEIWFDGDLVNPLSIAERAQRGMTLAWQEPARFEGLTVARYLSLGMDEPDEDRMRRALEAVALLPDTYLPRYVDDALSGGERKRIELASIYAMAPKLAILDEPDSGIDAMTLEDIAILIQNMAQEGTTILAITHRDEIVEIADAASLICEGEIVRTGTPDEVVERYGRCCRACDRAERVEKEADYERL